MQVKNRDEKLQASSRGLVEKLKPTEPLKVINPLGVRSGFLTYSSTARPFIYHIQAQVPLVPPPQLVSASLSSNPFPMSSVLDFFIQSGKDVSVQSHVRVFIDC